MAKVAVIALALALIITFLVSNKSVEASGGYRKPPFNGSIFGKRNSEGGGNVQNGDYLERTGTGGKLGTLCEIAAETCSAFYPESSR